MRRFAPVLLTLVLIGSCTQEQFEEIICPPGATETVGRPVPPVGDVVVPSPGDGTIPPTGQTVPPLGADVTLQVISLSSIAADVRVRFLVSDLVVHLAQLHVEPRERSAVIGPDRATLIEVTGAYATGGPIPARVFVYGIDFHEGAAAVYYLPDPGRPLSDPPSIVVLEPSSDVTVARGQGLLVVWNDADPDSNALIVAYLDPDGVDLNADEIQLGPPVAEDPDGPEADQALFIVGPTARLGTYQVLLTISDGTSVATARSTGRVTIVDANAAPRLTILEPASDVRVALGGTLRIRWDDVDDDSSAMVRFYLAPAGSGGLEGGRSVRVGPAFAEDPDGDGDVALVRVVGVSTGTYELFGTLDDGEVVVAARAAGRVIVTSGGGPPPEPCPNPPAVTSISPPFAAYNGAYTGVIYGENLVPGRTTVRFLREASDEVIEVEPSVSADGRTAGIELTFDGAGAGRWRLEVIVPGCPAAALSGVFIVTTYGDFDRDGDVDALDYSRLIDCLSGASVPAGPECHDCDSDLDGDVDLNDYAVFQTCFNGTDRPPAAGCNGR